MALATPSSLPTYLRAATQSAHRSLDQLPQLQALLQPTLSAQQYAEILCGLYRVFTPLEQAILDYTEQSDVQFDYRHRLKHPWLAADLQQLQQALPPLEDTLPITTPEDLLGICYVLEGSTLGGQIICQTLHKHFAERLPTRFYQGYGSATAQQWQDFWQFATTLPLDASHWERIAARALTVFASLQQVLLAEADSHAKTLHPHH